MTKLNKTLRNALIFVLIFTIFFLSDFLIKYFLFDLNDKSQKDYVVIGIRSMAHYSTTFLDFIKVSLDKWVNISISLTITFVLIIILTFVKSKVAAIGISIMIAGTLGNTLDNIFYGYVRDILYTPWWDRGTFNLADVLIIVGLPFALIPILISSFKEK